MQSHENERAALKSGLAKVSCRILPIGMVAYLLACIDRGNVSFASLQMNEDLKFSDATYGLAAGVFFVAYAVFEVPSSLLTARLGPRTWLSRMMMLWGFITVTTMFVRTPAQFYLARFLLGMAEAGFFPGLIFYLSGWFPKARRGRAIGLVYLAAPLAVVVTGAVSGRLLQLSGLGGLRGWQWLFLIEGLPAIVLGLVAIKVLPATPANAHWLTDDEQAAIVAAIGSETARIETPARDTIVATIIHPITLLLGAIGLLLNAATGGFGLSAPAVLIARTGYDAVHAGYVISVGGVLSAVVLLAVGWRGDRTGNRLSYALVGAVVIATALIALASGSTSLVAIVACLALAASAYPVGFLIASSWADFLHPRQLAVGAAAINTMWQIGAFVGPLCWGLAKQATGTYRLGLAAGGVLAMLMAGLILFLLAAVCAHHRRSAS